MNDFALSSFDLAQPVNELNVVIFAVDAVMDATMARRTQRDHIARIVWSAVAETSRVMRLQVRTAVASGKGCMSFTTLTMGPRSAQDVVPYVAAPLIDRSDTLNCGRDRCCVHGALAQVGNLGCLIGCTANFFIDGINRYQFENDRVANLACAVCVLLDLIPLANHLIDKAEPPCNGLEQKNRLPVSGMVGKSAVSTSQLHSSALPVAEIVEGTVFPSIIVPMLLAFCARDDDDERKPSRRDHTALLLSSKSCMDVGPSIVDAPAFKTPTHRLSPPFDDGGTLQ